jgi:lactate dehydrogenase-like 2-hydroxyacid dehydrogenase
MPDDDPMFADAVRAGGGEIAPLSEHTRGLVWLSYGDAQDLVAVLDAHPGIEWVQLPYAGVDAFSHVLAGYADRPLPLWTSAKGAYSQPVAEHALTLALALLRLIPQRVRATSWPTGEKFGTSLFGLNVLIVGAGGIAVELIRLLEPFGVHVTVVRRSQGDLAGAELTVTSDRLGEVLPDADVVVIANPDRAYQSLPLKRGQVVIDTWRLLRSEAPEDGYVPLGLGEQPGSLGKQLADLRDGTAFRKS